MPVLYTEWGGLPAGSAGPPVVSWPPGGLLTAFVWLCFHVLVTCLVFWFELGLDFNIDQPALTDMHVSMARETAQGIQAPNKSQLLCQHFNSENVFPVCLNLKSPPVELWVDRGQLRPCSSGQHVASNGYKGPQGSPQPQGGDLCCVLFLQQPTRELLLSNVLCLLTTCSVV